MDGGYDFGCVPIGGQNDYCVFVCQNGVPAGRNSPPHRSFIDQSVSMTTEQCRILVIVHE